MEVWWLRSDFRRVSRCKSDVLHLFWWGAEAAPLFSFGAAIFYPWSLPMQVRSPAIFFFFWWGQNATPPFDRRCYFFTTYIRSNKIYSLRRVKVLEKPKRRVSGQRKGQLADYYCHASQGDEFYQEIPTHKRCYSPTTLQHGKTEGTASLHYPARAFVYYHRSSC